MRVGSIHTPRDSRRPGATPRQAARPVLAEGRVRLVGLGLLTLFLLLLGRALYLQVVSQDFLQDQGSARYSRVLRLEATRGMITDRNNEPLAISSPVESIWASPADMDPVPAAQVARLARLLDMPADLIGRRLADKRREFVYLKRQISPELAREVMALGIPGISTQPEFRRFYPAGEITSHLVGYTGIDGQGMEGMELTRESMLAGAAGRRHVIKDRRGHVVEDIAAIERPRDGQTLTLSIDRRIQYLAWRELKVAMEKSNAKAASMVVIDARTGEVLALVNLPTFNPNSRSTMAPELRRNHAVIDIYEPGSTLKPFAIAKALDAGLVRPNQVFETLPYMIGPARIRDTHDYPALDVAGVLQKSSNVGSSK
ncbi:penicillin-binding protein 2, partial [Laribacter hongkongensis]